MRIQRKLGTAYLTVAILLGGLGCDSSSDDALPAEATYAIEVAGVETFNIHLDDAAAIQEAERLLDTGASRNVAGRLMRGDGGFNAPYGWHLDPATVEFADITIELCDGLPSFIDEDLDYWVDTVGQYCPWGVTVVARVE